MRLGRVVNLTAVAQFPSGRDNRSKSSKPCVGVVPSCHRTPMGSYDRGVDMLSALFLIPASHWSRSKPLPGTINLQ